MNILEWFSTVVTGLGFQWDTNTQVIVLVLALGAFVVFRFVLNNIFRVAIIVAIIGGGYALITTQDSATDTDQESDTGVQPVVET